MIKAIIIGVLCVFLVFLMACLLSCIVMAGRCDQQEEKRMAERNHEKID